VNGYVHERGRAPGNREVSRSVMRAQRAVLGKEGGPWGKHGFPHGSEPEASDS
jgi:hypothetical protein